MTLLTPVVHLDRYEERIHLLLGQSTELYGREQEVATASALLQHSDTRLLVITGPGGVGKTHLALQVAIEVAESFPDGICYISLGSLKDAALIFPAIARELGLAETGEESSLAQMEAYLRDKCLLLLLDNFEQVIEAAPALASLVFVCPELKILVTSRETLHLHIEHVFVVPPLALPDLKQELDSGQIARSAAVEFFVQRAMAVKPDFQLTPSNARVIAEICVRLDGLPLAIELAAARIRLLPPQMLLERLDHRLQILTGGARDLPRRQQTLRNTLAWSYDLLSEEERSIFRLLSVFTHGCGLKTAEDVCLSVHGPTLNVLEIIASLVDKNLLQRVEQSDGDVRVLMLETVHEYGQECLLHCGETGLVYKAYALYYVALAEMAEPELRRVQQAKWLNYLEQEYDNLLASLRWLISQEKTEAALSLCGALCRFWLISGHQNEGYEWIKRALVGNERANLSLEVRAKAHFTAGILANDQGQHQHSIEFLQKSLAAYQELHDHHGIAATLNALGNAYARIAPSEAHRFSQESLKLSRKHNDLWNSIDALLSLAHEAMSLTDFALAHRQFEECLALSNIQGDKRSMASCLGGLGQIALREGRYAEAQALLKRSLEIYQAIRDRTNIAFTLVPWGMAARYQRDYLASQVLLEESSHASRRSDDQSRIANYLGSLGEIALRSQQEDNLPAQTFLAESLTIFWEAGHEEDMASHLFALGCMEHAQGAFVAAIQLLEESLLLFTKLGNRVMAAIALITMGHAYSHQGQYKSARSFLERSLDITREIEDRWKMTYGLSHLGLVALNDGDYTTAHAFMEQSLAAAREIGDSRCLAEALSVMGLFYMNNENYVLAQTLLEESLTLSEKAGDRYFIAYRLADLELLAIRKGNYTQARTMVEESLTLSLQMDNRWFIASCLERLGEVVVMQGQPMWATQLWGAAASMRAVIGAPIPTIERTPYEKAVTTARMQLGEELFGATWKVGYALAPRHVIAVQPVGEMSRKEELLPRRSVKVLSLSSAPPDGLTLREVEVLSLVANGLTNGQIAEKLVISVHTVHAHLSSIYRKLSLSSRTAATRYAIEHKIS